MSDSNKPSPTEPTLQQQIVRRKLNEDMAKILNRRPTSALGHYARSVVEASDWTIEEQPARFLPFGVSQWITLQQRDLGNALIEETRLLNNQYAGCSFQTATVILAGDPDFLDLHARVQAWSVEIAKQLNFKLRHQARKDPYRTFFNAYDAIVAPLDADIVHGRERLYALVWETAVDLLPYQLLDALVFQPGHCKLWHDATRAHAPSLRLTHDLPSHDQERLSTVISMYAVEAVAYLDKVVLAPLLAALRQDHTIPGPEQRAIQYRQMFADLQEAYPYLLSSDRAERYLFSIPGTTCVAAVSFLTPNGCARIVFADDVEKLRQGLHTNFVRGALNIAYDGQLQWWMHPWRTLALIFGEVDALTLSWWLLKQIHAQMVKDFLAIERYYLHGEDAQTLRSDAAEIPDEALLYVALAKASGEPDVMGDTVVTPLSGTAQEGEGGQGSNMLPQLRRRYFLKLLAHCGVEVAQGKGSEIKLLRKTKRPFRLGNHYGSNPTIPAYLAASILKRLEITGEEWAEALASG